MSEQQAGFEWLERMIANEPVARKQWQARDFLEGWDPERSDANLFYTDLLADPDGHVSEVPLPDDYGRGLPPSDPSGPGISAERG